MPVSTLPCPSRSSGLSRLVVDSTTRPPYHPQTIFKPTLNHLSTNLRCPIPNFILGLPFCLEFVLFRLHSRLKRFWIWPGAHEGSKGFRLRRLFFGRLILRPLSP